MAGSFRERYLPLAVHRPSQTPHIEIQQGSRKVYVMSTQIGELIETLTEMNRLYGIGE